MLAQTMFEAPKMLPSRRNAATSAARVVIPATNMENKTYLFEEVVLTPPPIVQFGQCAVCNHDNYTPEVL